MEKAHNLVDVDRILSELGMAMLQHKPCRFKLSLQDLEQIAWIRKELEDIQKEEESYLNGEFHEIETDMVAIRTLNESHLFTKKDVESGTWARTLIREALRTKPIDATHITLYTA